MCLISGGNWNNTSNAGVWALNLNNNRTNSNNNVGFRAADSDSASRPARVQWSHRDVVSCSGPPRRNLLFWLLSGSASEGQEPATTRQCLTEWAQAAGRLPLPDVLAFVASAALVWVAPQLVAALLAWWLVLLPLMVAFLEAPRR